MHLIGRMRLFFEARRASACLSILCTPISPRTILRFEGGVRAGLQAVEDFMQTPPAHNDVSALTLLRTS